MEKKISVRISGNPAEASGFQSLVLANNPTFVINDVGYSGFANNSYFFTIKIEENEVVYKLIKNNVHSNGASRLGSLIIGISVPRGYKIAGSTPYDVLMLLKNEFISKCMTCRDQVTDRYEYNKGIIDYAMFNNIANQVILEPARCPHYPMPKAGNIGYIITSEEKIKQLLNDVQYKIFTNYKEVVVAQVVDANEYLKITDIEIPRVPKYIINDGTQNILINNITQKITVQGTKDPQYYNNTVVSFTIKDLIEGKVIPGITIDFEKETINVNIENLSSPISRKFYIKIEPVMYQADIYQYIKDLRLSVPERYIRIDNDLSFTLVGEGLKYLTSNQLNISLIGNLEKKYQYVSKTISFNPNELKIQIKKIAPAPMPTPPVKAGVTEVQFNIEETEKIKPQRFKSTLLVKDHNEEGIQRTKLELIQDSKRRAYVANTYLSTKLISSGVIFEFCDNKNLYESRTLKPKDGVINVTSKDLRVSKKTFFARFITPKKSLVLFIVGLLLGASLMFLVDLLFAPNENVETPKTQPQPKEKISVNKGIGYSECDMCGDSFEGPDKLQKHVNEEHPQCQECKQRFKDTRELKEHEGKEHKKPSEDNVEVEKNKL